MTRLLALVQKPVGQSPGQRFRLEQWAPHLSAEHGVQLHFAPFEGPRLNAVIYRAGRRLEKAAWMLEDTIRRAGAVAESRRYDGVVLYREAASLGPALYERVLARAGVPLLLDFDDAIWLPSTGGANGVFSHLRFAGKTATICRLANAVVVGNEYLAAYARRSAPDAEAVFVVPTSIELSRYPLQPELAPSAPFTIVWSGSFSTLVHLERARAPLEALGRRRRVVLRVIGNRPPARPFAGVETEFVAWREQGEAATLGQAHVGIMPLPDDAFARGKCGLKALQYMAVGVPSVVSPVGVNAEIVDHGKNGLLASTDEEWVSALESLADAPDLRRRLAAAARRTVEERYAAPISAARFAAAVHHALGRGASQVSTSRRRSAREGCKKT